MSLCKKKLYEEFEGREVVGVSYGVDSDRASYNLSYFPLKVSVADSKNVNRIYDRFDKELLKRANSGLRGVTTQIIGKKEFYVGDKVGRETMTRDIEEGTSLVRQIYINGKFYYFSVGVEPFLKAPDKDIVTKASERFYNSFQIIQK